MRETGLAGKNALNSVKNSTETKMAENCKMNKTNGQVHDFVLRPGSGVGAGRMHSFCATNHSQEIKAAPKRMEECKICDKR